MRKLKFNSNKGITLIALVITIIVLLILAGVSIATLTGENGILTQAQRANEETKIATVEEQRKLAIGEATTNFEETEYQGIPIPAGMAPTRIEGESTVEEGLVAIDKNGNEWVWIKVPKPEKTEGLTFANETNYSDEDENECKILTEELKKYAESYTKSDRTDEYHEGCGLEEDEYKENYQKMLKSIYKNEGFWIGRYEAGIEGSRGIDKESLDLGRTESNKGTTKEKAICQKDAIPYNFITVSEAQKLASQMTPDVTKTSSLMFGIQWDLICKYLEENSDLNEEDIKEDSRSWGNYKDQTVGINSRNAKQFDSNKWSITTGEKAANSIILLSAGASNKTKKLNIYDLAGNGCELTLERAPDFSVYKGVFSTRGGVVGYSENLYSASCYGVIPKDESSSGRVFRPSLY